MLVISIVFAALFQTVASLQYNATEGAENITNPRHIGPGDPTRPFRVHWYSGQLNKGLRCQTWGDPMPNITWFTDYGLRPGKAPSLQDFKMKKMKILPPTSNDVSSGWSELAFAKVNYSLEANYYCYAKNDKGIANRLFKVVVHAPLETATIIVGVTSGMLILILICILVIFGREFVKQKRSLKHISKDEEKEFRDGDETVMHASSNHYVGSAQILIQAQPYNPKFEIPREKIICYNHQVLGTGEFGIVVQGAIQDCKGRMIHAAVKTTRSDVDLDYFRALLSEVKIMSFIGKHPNVVNLIGACTASIGKNELLVAVELCPKGNLRDFLRKNRETFIDLVADGMLDPDTKDNSSDFSTIQLIRWSSEVARGMEFLASKNVIHADLAARNILLTSKMVSKISDFGLSRQLVDYTNYVKKQQCPLPWKWMAMESLKDMHFSIQSDVWAYGVVLWELFSLGEAPYPGQSWSQDFLKGLTDGQRLPSPTYATEIIYRTMLSCWDEDPRSRPSFHTLKQTFENMLAERAGKDYMDVIQGDYRDLNQDSLEYKLEDYKKTQLLMIEVPEELSKPSPEQKI